MFIYRRATLKDLNNIWDKDIEQNKDDKRYIKWKEEFILANKEEKIVTFVVLKDEDPIGQISVAFDPLCLKVKCRDMCVMVKKQLT